MFHELYMFNCTEELNMPCEMEISWSNGDNFGKWAQRMY
jgi:hypothetical protein